VLRRRWYCGAALVLLRRCAARQRAQALVPATVQDAVAHRARLQRALVPLPDREPRQGRLGRGSGAARARLGRGSGAARARLGRGSGAARARLGRRHDGRKQVRGGQGGRREHHRAGARVLLRQRRLRDVLRGVVPRVSWRVGRAVGLRRAGGRVPAGTEWLQTSELTERPNDRTRVLTRDHECAAPHAPALGPPLRAGAATRSI
jgi:hypothetical protein